MKKLLLVLSILILFTAVNSPAYAQGTILPKASDKEKCDQLIRHFNDTGLFQTTDMQTSQQGAFGPTDTLGCAIVTGRVSLPMIPYFIQYFSNYALSLVSILALLFIVIGGFLYTLGGMTEQKDKGKNFIKNAIIGMIIAFMAWTIVNVIISAVTG